ncbi:MAG: DoxX family protein [Verrucomicrobiales bacterium]|jgi:putative oxidoreductase|nr:DoxX family protein [Verrucomicrobiales bacterium]
MKKLIQKAISPGSHDQLSSLGILILRLFTGGCMLFAHGWGKLTKFGELSGKFADPIGLGSAPSLALAVFAEVFCAIAIMLGLFTRAAAIPLLITMLVAAFVVHDADPFQKKEFALLYAAPFLMLILTGAGSFSVDAKLKR